MCHSHLNITDKVIPQSVEFLHMIDVLAHLLFVSYSVACIEGLCEHGARTLYFI